MRANASNMLCVRKARLGDMICTLSNQEMKKIDESNAKAVGIMSYYGQLLKKLEDKNRYIERIKTERNIAQDKLNVIRKIIGVEDDNEIESYLINLKKSVDSSSRN